MRYKVIAGLPALLALLGCVHPQEPGSAAPAGAQQAPDSAQVTGKASPDNTGSQPAQAQAPALANPAATQGPTKGVSKPPARSTGTPQGAAADAANGTSSKPAAPRNSSAAPGAGSSGAGKTHNATTTTQPAPAPVKTPASTPAAPAAPSLDLAALEARLKQTRAIGVFTKLSLKNQVDDLLSQFRAFHGKKAAGPLSSLRDKYDLLLIKVLSLLQDGDPDLAASISSSREAIWGVLADPQKFAKL